MKTSHEHGWSCSCWRLFGAILWVAGAVALVLAWVSVSKGMVLGMDTSRWYANALILAVLAIPMKLKGRGMECECGTCK
ncbi:MAG: hypothetical protein AAB518_00025 [Patescibacteria group bacterium]